MQTGSDRYSQVGVYSILFWDFVFKQNEIEQVSKQECKQDKR
jgi:hypothetical protein